MADAAVIQCPTCSKKFKLPERPPAVFTCTGCQTPMDLSGFRPADAAPAAESESADVPTRRAAGSTRSTGRAGARSTARSSARAAAPPTRTARSSRSRDVDEDDDDDRAPPPPKKSNGPIIGALIGFVVIVGIVFLALGGKGKDADGKKSAAKKSAEEAPVVAPPVVEAQPEAKPEPPPKPAQGQIHEVGHHPESTPDEQRTIDDLVEKSVFQDLGRDSVDAGKELVKLGLKAAPRLINVFHTVNGKEGLGTLEGNKKAAIADAHLRKIDGYQERVRKVKQSIRPVSDKDFVMGVARGWNLYWDKEYWKKEPNKPWDPRYDETDDK